MAVAARAATVPRRRVPQLQSETRDWPAPPPQFDTDVQTPPLLRLSRILAMTVPRGNTRSVATRGP
jgi:hypothetical protein